MAEILKNMGSLLKESGLGGIQKAYLIIHRTDVNQLDSQKISQKTLAALEAAGSSAGAQAVSDVMGFIGLQTHVMQVQYNPSSLAMQATAEEVSFSCLQQNIDAGIPNQNIRPPMVMLAVELIFDAVNPQDAFMLDKTRISAGTIVSDVSGIVQNKKHGGYTVQPQTEGLIAALIRPDTRLVTFRWADMAFTGQIVEVQADYNMFSVSGKPIRSKVRMNIAQQVESDADFQYWDKALNKMFKDTNPVDLKSTGQKVGNLLNLDAF